MSWTILYHPDVEEDLSSVGPAMARRILRAIDTKLREAPHQFGAPLSGNLADFRKLRIGDYRVVYQIHHDQIIVFVLAVGPRRDKEIYRQALQRLTPEGVVK